MRVELSEVELALLCEALDSDTVDHAEDCDEHCGAGCCDCRCHEDTESDVAGILACRTLAERLRGMLPAAGS